MNTILGKLKILPVKDNLDLLAEPVRKAIFNIPELAEQAGVVEIDPELSDTAAFCEHYDVGMNQAANCVILEASRGDRKWFAACVVLGNSRADVNGLARRTLDARRASFAPMETAVKETGMEYGGISPIGLPSDWPLLIDAAITQLPQVIIGSSIRKSKIVVPGSALKLLPNVEVLEGLGQARK